MWEFLNKTISYEEKRNIIYRHLYEMNIKQLIREQKVITDAWKEICYETAQGDVRHLMLCGNIDGYYKRLIKGAV